MDQRDLERLLSTRDHHDDGDLELPQTIDQARRLISRRNGLGIAGRAMQLSVVAIAVLAAGLVTRSLPFGASPAPSASQVASASAMPSVSPSAACREELALVILSWSGTGDARLGDALIVNGDDHVCRLEVVTALRIADATGQPIVEVSSSTLTSARALTPGTGLSLGLLWSNWCGEAPILPLTAIAETSDGVRLSWRFTDADPATVPACSRMGEASDLVLRDAAPWGPEDAPADAPACLADRLGGAVLPPRSADGAIVTRVLLVNHTDSACSLRGHSTVILSDAGGLLAATVSPDGGSDPWQSPDDPTVVLPAHGMSTATMTWSTWCGPAPFGFLQLVLDLPDGGGNLLITGADTLAPACAGAGGSSLDLGAWR